MLIDSPWARVRNPVTVPGTLTVEDLAQMPDLQFAELIRSNLVPRDQSKQGRLTWDRLWVLLRGSDRLADRTYDVLEEFLDAADTAIDSGRLDEQQAKRAAKFTEQCRQSWERIDRDAPAQPLAWAGRAGDFQPAARRVIATLVGAIAHHRSAITDSRGNHAQADNELWDILRQVSLDPDDYPSSADDSTDSYGTMQDSRSADRPNRPGAADLHSRKLSPAPQYTRHGGKKPDE